MTRRVNALCDRAAWEGVLELRDDCRAAVARGKQLWPIASYCEYRLALDGPDRLAAKVLEPGTGHFALGPLSEVVAAGHEWNDLAPHVDHGPVAGLAAHECVLRGEDLRDADVPSAEVCEVPLVLADWEPEYPLADYDVDEATFPSPPLPALDPISLPTEEPALITDVDAVDALAATVTVWQTESNGRIETAAVEGRAAAALRGLGVPAARLGEVPAADAFALLAWAAASGGAHGRRRGMAPGRFAAWWVAVAVAGRLDDWPLPADVVGEIAQRLRWYVWDGAEPTTGWHLRVAIEVPERGLSFALNAIDAV
jgi:hypothetical protein